MYWIIGGLWLGAIGGMVWFGTRSYKRSQNLRGQNITLTDYVSGEE